MNLLKLIPAASLALTLMACEKEIAFEYHQIPPEPVIEGLLTGEGVEVRLSQTVATDEPFRPPLTDADVRVTDLTDGSSYSLLSDSAGFFTAEGLRGVTGHCYELTVERGGESFVARSTMLDTIAIISAGFSWIRMPYDDVAVLRVEVTASSDPLICYWMRVYRNGEVYQWQAMEGRNVDNGVATGMMMTSRRDIEQEDDADRLVDGDSVMIEVMPISRLMFDYLASLNNGDYNGLRLFSGSSPCLGYFLAAPMARTTIIYRPDDFTYAH